MGLGSKLHNIDKFYEEVVESKQGLILLNDYTLNGNNLDEILVEISTVYDGEPIVTEPHCKCYNLRGHFRIKNGQGQRCHDCGTDVVDQKNNFNPTIWMRTITDQKFISPKLWMLINQALSIQYDTLLAIVDIKYFKNIKMKHLETVKEMHNFEHSYRFLYENFFEIIELLILEMKPVHKANMIILLQYMRDNEGELFSTHLPVLSKKFFITEKIAKRTYTDKLVHYSIAKVMDFVKMVTSGSDWEKDVIMGRTIAQSANVVKGYYSSSLSGKEGGVQSKIFKTRIPFSGRTVGVSICRPHHMEQFELPWRIGLVIFRAHLMNRLVDQYGYSLKEVNRKLIIAYNQYDSELDDIFQALIRESRDPMGIEMILQRNPTLELSSILYLKLWKVKIDPFDNAVSMSALLMTFLSGDFDGDEYSFALLVCNYIADGFKSLAPSSSVMSNQDVGEVSNMITITKATTCMMAKYMHKDGIKTPVTKNSIFKMKGDQ